MNTYRGGLCAAKKKSYITGDILVFVVTSHTNILNVPGTQNHHFILLINKYPTEAFYRIPIGTF